MISSLHGISATATGTGNLSPKTSQHIGFKPIAD